MGSVIDNLLAGVVADGPRLAPFGPPASAAALAAVAACRTLHCDECPGEAEGRCDGCGKLLCAACRDRHRRAVPQAGECRGRWNEPQADELAELQSR